MAKRRPVQINGQDFSSGVFLVDKPCGASSFAIVRRIRWLLGIKKVGHAGTLDPFATGLLVICAGRPATRHIEHFMGGRKTYQACLQLGQETTTLDPEGEVIRVRPVGSLENETLRECLDAFHGPQVQAPPPFSAAKHKGKPLYYYARKGVIIEKEPKPIEIYSIGFDGYDQTTARLNIEVSCSRGTYIRVLASDIGRRLGCGAHLVALRRTVSGPFNVSDSLTGKSLEGDSGLQELLSGMMSVEEALARTGVSELNTGMNNTGV